MGTVVLLIGTGIVDTSAKGCYRHQTLGAALRAAARAILEEAGPLHVGLHEVARRVGVHPTAAYDHFSCKEHLLASIAAEGFDELFAAMVASDEDPASEGLGLAYVEFATQNPGLFRLMFGPILLSRSKYPCLSHSAGSVFDLLKHSAVIVEDGPQKDTSPMATWGLMHGLSSLLIEGALPAIGAHALAQKILCHA